MTDGSQVYPTHKRDTVKTTSGTRMTTFAGNVQMHEYVFGGLVELRRSKKMEDTELNHIQNTNSVPNCRTSANLQSARNAPPATSSIADSATTIDRPYGCLVMMRMLEPIGLDAENIAVFENYIGRNSAPLPVTDALHGSLSGNNSKQLCDFGGATEPIDDVFVGLHGSN